MKSKTDRIFYDHKIVTVDLYEIALFLFTYSNATIVAIPKRYPSDISSNDGWVALEIDNEVELVFNGSANNISRA